MPGLNKIFNHPYFLPFFLVLWGFVNVMQAWSTELNGDEAYYFMYTKAMDWGFKDHPPLIGLFIKWGYSVFQNELGVRLASVLVNVGLLAILWHLAAVKEQMKYLVMLVLCMPAFQIYAFIATPDVPLLLFVALFLWAYRNYLLLPGWRNALWLSLTMSGMLWSKYHGGLIIGLAILSNLRLLLDKRFWSAGILALLLFLPHLYWQYSHDFVTFKYHLVGRSGAFEWRFFFDYLLGQVGIWNPVILLVTLMVLIKRRPKDAFERSLYWIIIGFLAFFMFSSLRGKVEPHWTAAAALPIIIILLRAFDEGLTQRRWIVISALPVMALIVVARLALVIDFLPFLKDFHHNRENALELADQAQGRPVVFVNTYQQTSLYHFYTGQLTHDLNNVSYGKYSYDIWRYDEEISRKPFLLVQYYWGDSVHHQTMKSGREFYHRDMEDYPFYQKMELLSEQKEIQGKPGQRYTMNALIKNPLRYDIDFDDTNNPLVLLAYVNYKKDDQAIFEVYVAPRPHQIKAGEEYPCTLSFMIPQGVGKKKLKFALKTRDLDPTYCSDWFDLELQ